MPRSALVRTRHDPVTDARGTVVTSTRSPFARRTAAIATWNPARRSITRATRITTVAASSRRRQGGSGRSSRPRCPRWTYTNGRIRAPTIAPGDYDRSGPGPASPTRPRRYPGAHGERAFTPIDRSRWCRQRRSRPQPRSARSSASCARPRRPTRPCSRSPRTPLEVVPGTRQIRLGRELVRCRPARIRRHRNGRPRDAHRSGDMDGAAGADARPKR
jgi:hypothetical protein